MMGNGTGLLAEGVPWKPMVAVAACCLMLSLLVLISAKSLRRQRRRKLFEHRVLRGQVGPDDTKQDTNDDDGDDGFIEDGYMDEILAPTVDMETESHSPTYEDEDSY